MTLQLCKLPLEQAARRDLQALTSILSGSPGSMMTKLFAAALAVTASSAFAAPVHNRWQPAARPAGSKHQEVAEFAGCALPQMRPDAGATKSFCNH